MVEYKTTSKATVGVSHVPQEPQQATTTALPTSICLRACSTIRTACKNECANEPSDVGCLPECTSDYDECVQECGTVAVQSGNEQTAATNSNNQEKVSCMMECSVENVDCMVECQTDVTDTSCLPECTAELSECQKECNDNFPDTNANTAVNAATVADPIQIEILTGTKGNNAQTGNYNVYTAQTLSSKTDAIQATDNSAGWVDPSGNVQTQSYSIHSTCVRQCSTEQSDCEGECLTTDPSCRNECKLEYDDCVIECNEDFGHTTSNAVNSQILPSFRSTPNTVTGNASPSINNVIAQPVASTNSKTEVVIKTGEGQVRTSTTKQTSILKILCLSSSVIERRSCLEECKIGTPETGCTTECYEDYKENVAECKEEEIERQEENAEKEQEKESENNKLSDNKQDQEEDYESDSSSESNES